MRRIELTNRFKRQFKLMLKRGKQEAALREVLEPLANDLPLPIKYRDHALTGNLVRFRELHIEPDWLLVYQKYDEEGIGILSLELTGTHSDLF